VNVKFLFELFVIQLNHSFYSSRNPNPTYKKLILSPLNNKFNEWQTDRIIHVVKIIELRQTQLKIWKIDIASLIIILCN